jgi:hypothetical protein
MLSTVRFDPGDPSQRRFNAYGPAPFPDGRDATLDGYVRELRDGGAGAVEAAAAAASERGQGVLRAYAERAASRAVRDRRAELLELALLAMVAGGVADGDEALMAMPLIEDAAQRLGSDPARLFADVGRRSGRAGAAALAAWLARAPKDRTLACMGFAADEDDGGFRRYRFVA